MTSTQATLHQPVLLQESITALNMQAEGIYLDGTFGRGGHSKVLLKTLSSEAQLIALDRDLSAIEYGQAKFANEPRLHLVHTDFAGMREALSARQLPTKFDGILFDLGVSSPQLDEAGRGFSFLRDGPLDMRMDDSQGETAADFLATAEEQTIANVIYQLGEEKFSRRIARAIIEKRQEKPLETTLELVELLEQAIPRKDPNKHPATRTFLALRMHINDELGQIEDMLPQAVQMLKTGGRLAIISFHSREDRIVKQFFRQLSRGPTIPKNLPVLEVYQPPIKTVGKAIKPSKQELSSNPRSRSAILRVAERTEVPYG